MKMNKITIVLTLLLMSITFTQAQKKKDLLDEIENLKQELRSTKGDLATANKKVSAGEAKVKTMEVQVNDLKETNASLLTNMSSFTELSNKKAANLQTSQEIIKQKDRQLKTINDAITAQDSINLATFSKLKNALGGDQVKIGGSTIYIMLPNSNLFGSDKNHDVNADAKPMLAKIAQVINTNPELGIIVEGNSNALKFDGKDIKNNWDLSARQAASVAAVLETEYEVPPKRIEVLGKGEHGSQAIETVTRIIIDPNFDQFYGMVKDNMKNAMK